MTKKKARLFVGAFLVTAVFIGGMAGFLLVDLASDRYMPGQLEPIFLIGEVGPQGAELSWMGNTYRLDARQVQQMQQALWEYRGLLPTELRLGGGICVRVMELYESLREARAGGTS